MDASGKLAFLCPKRADWSVMAEENMTAQEVESPESETDWKAKYDEMRNHMRDWEKKAKANQSAADELEKLKAAQMSEQERERARADAAEAELARLKAEQSRAEAAQRISAEGGVPLELLMFCADEDAMAEFAKAYERDAHVRSAPSALAGSRIVRGNDKPRDNGELFAEFAQHLFKQ